MVVNMKILRFINYILTENSMEDGEYYREFILILIKNWTSILDATHPREGLGSAIEQQTNIGWKRIPSSSRFFNSCE